MVPLPDVTGCADRQIYCADHPRHRSHVHGAFIRRIGYQRDRPFRVGPTIADCASCARRRIRSGQSAARHHRLVVEGRRASRSRAAIAGSQAPRRDRRFGRHAVLDDLAATAPDRVRAPRHCPPAGHDERRTSLHGFASIKSSIAFDRCPLRSVGVPAASWWMAKAPLASFGGDNSCYRKRAAEPVPIH